ncbi:MAG: FAD-dependent monooxygenase, partial [Pseudomonadota bacterium]
GAGIQVTPNGARVLDALGLAAAAEATGMRAEAVAPMAALTGRSIARFDLSHQSPPYRFFRRPDLVGLLADACRDAGVAIELNARVAATDDLGADVIVGADGIKSVVRPFVVGHADAPFFTGQVAWRAIVPDMAADPVARIWMAPGRHLVTYPLPGGGLNLVAVREQADWAEEGWSHEDDPENLRRAFGDCSDHVKTILQGVDKVNLWGLFRHPIPETWYRDHVVLLGDAAHPTLPFLAQGANLAIEDAYVLAACVAAHEDVATGLQAYQAARKPRVTRAISAANANARNYHLGGIQAAVAHTGLGLLGRVAPNLFLSRLSWLYDHDVTAQDYQLAAV